MPEPSQGPAALSESDPADSAYSWTRLAIAVLIASIGNVGMWSVVVVLPAIEQDFQLTRAAAALPYMLMTIGFGLGGIVMGRLADRHGVTVPLAIGAVAIGAGYVLSGISQNVWQFALAHGVLIGLFGSSAAFGPLIADISLWFRRHRGIAVAICASGNYLAGTIWPPILQQFVTTAGWRATHIGVGLFCLLTMLPLAALLRRRPPRPVTALHGSAPWTSDRAAGLSPGVLQALLILAGIACCVAMSMPQVHIVALCADRGFGVARGAEMLSLMLGFGIISRLLSGALSDRIGGLATLMIGSILQSIALILYLRADGLTSLYVVSALFGLFQGGLVPSYAIIVRENYPPEEAATRVGLVLMATLGGMALGGWLSGAIYDLTGSYAYAFLNGIAWNLVNILIVAWLLFRATSNRRRRQIATAPA
ncbi:MAG: MFS transporter [Hyphomicrobiaceae bacterium]